MGTIWFVIWLVYVPEWPSDDTLIASRERLLFESCAIYAKQRAHEIRRERTESCRDESSMTQAATGKKHSLYSLLSPEVKARLRIASGRLRAVPALAMLRSAPLWAIFVAMFCRVWMWYFLVLYQSFYVRTQHNIVHKLRERKKASVIVFRFTSLTDPGGVRLRHQHGACAY